MSKINKYQEALDRPSKKKIGWTNADDDSMLAAVAQVIAGKNALSPKGLYEQAKFNNISPLELEAMEYPDPLDLCLGIGRFNHPDGSLEESTPTVKRPPAGA